MPTPREGKSNKIVTPPILFEDSDVLIIDKSAGIVVNKAESVKSETVQDWVEKTYRIFIENRAGIVHRIDKETSGILLVAKNSETFYELQKQFKERSIKKTYLALVHGKLQGEGEIRAPVARLPWNTERFGIVPGGKEALTKYKVFKNYNDYTVVELYPETGRTHQIRVHLKYINHPIVGDYLYAGRKTSRDDRKTVGRVMLHAWKISFTHPKTGKRISLEAPIPDDMMKVV